MVSKSTPLIILGLTLLLLNTPVVYSIFRVQKPRPDILPQRLSRRLDETIRQENARISRHPVSLEQSPKKAWSHVFGGPGEDVAGSVVETSDGGFAIAGYTYSFGAGKSDVWVIRTDAEGNPLWNQTFGGAGYDRGYSIVECRDGGFAVLCEFDLYTNDSMVGVVRTDGDGTLLWNQSYGGVRGAVNSIVECTEGGFAIAGTSYRLDPLGDFWLFRTNESGYLLWNQTYSGGSQDIGRSVVEVRGGGFAIVGYSYCLGEVGPGLYVWLVLTDENGNHLWNHTYGTSGWVKGYSVIESQDGGFVITGTDNEGEGSDMYLVRTDAEGTLLWNQTYGGPYNDGGYSVVECGEEGFAIAGYTESFWSDFDVWLIRTDTEGNLLWNQPYGGGHVDVGYSIVACSEGGFIITGITQSFDVEECDVWLLRIPADMPIITVDTPIPWGAIVLLFVLVLTIFFGVFLALKPHHVKKEITT